jgi:hypothetical protein
MFQAKAVSIFALGADLPLVWTEIKCPSLRKQLAEDSEALQFTASRWKQISATVLAAVKNPGIEPGLTKTNQYSSCLDKINRRLIQFLSARPYLLKGHIHAPRLEDRLELCTLAIKPLPRALSRAVGNNIVAQIRKPLAGIRLSEQVVQGCPDL